MLALASLLLGAAAVWWTLRPAPPASPSVSHTATPVPPAAVAPGGAAATTAAIGNPVPAAPAPPTATSATPHASAVAVAPPATLRFSPAEARAYMREQQQRSQCAMARIAMEATAIDRVEREWRWLPPAQASAERAARASAIARLAQDCPARPVAESAQDARTRMAAAAAAGDLEARLRQFSRTPLAQQDPQVLRELLHEVLRGGDPELVAQIQFMEFYLRRQPFLFVPSLPSGFAWELLACDLGRECGAGSPALDRMCLLYPAACTQPSVEEAWRQQLSLRDFRRARQRRDELLARIRSGQIDGIFDPPPPATGGP